MGYRLGVDLGTTFTAAAVDDGGGARMVGLGNRALQVPSVLFLQPDGSFLCGEAAERRSATEPDRVVREFKRRLGDTVPMLVAGQPFSPQSLTATLLRWVVATVAERQGGGPEEVVLTRPANWGGFKQELFAQVGSLADLGRVVSCTEPEAAATQYASRARLVPGARVVVYDLGGGTFDVCVLEKREVGFGIVGSPDGVEHLGGIDFDEALFRHVLGLVADRLGALDPDDVQVTAALARLRRECVEAKEALSNDVSTAVPVAFPGLSTSVRVTRPELEELIGPALRETLAATQRAMRSSATEAEDLSAVVLVGGSSRIPLVGQLLQDELGVRTAMDTHPKHDIPLGAARFAVDGAAPEAAVPRDEPKAAAEPLVEVEKEPELAIAPSSGATAKVDRQARRPRAPGRRVVYGALALVALVTGVLLAFLALDPPAKNSTTSVSRWSGDADLPRTPRAEKGELRAFDVPLPGTSKVTTNREGSSVGLSTTQWLFITGPVEVVLMNAEDEVIEGERFLKPVNQKGRWYQPVANVPGVAMILLALFALAYGESLTRGLRQGTRTLRAGELIGMTGVGLLLGAVVVLASWMSGRLPELDIDIIVLALGGAAGALTAGAVASSERRATS